MNQNPEQIARDHIDELLKVSGWIVQSKQQINEIARAFLKKRLNENILTI
jgi:type I site-specific restriction endonuclease